MKQIPFIDRPPTAHEVEKLRLILSTYQDGTGETISKWPATLPGGRDFERSVALAFGGEAQGSKAIFDVLLPDLNREGIKYGVSCKMRETLKNVEKTGQITIEVSNSNSKFRATLEAGGLVENNYENMPARVGEVVIDLVKSWHTAVSVESGGKVDIARSFYLVLQWNRKTGLYQLYQFPLALPNAQALRWKVSGKRLIGDDGERIFIEWYWRSGGQLKYYPFAADAIWVSERFQLEPLLENKVGYAILSRVAEYFPAAWAEVCKRQ